MNLPDSQEAERVVCHYHVHFPELNVRKLPESFKFFACALGIFLVVNSAGVLLSAFAPESAPICSEQTQ